MGNIENTNENRNFNIKRWVEVLKEKTDPAARTEVIKNMVLASGEMTEYRPLPGEVQIDVAKLNAEGEQVVATLESMSAEEQNVLFDSLVAYQDVQEQLNKINRTLDEVGTALITQRMRNNLFKAAGLPDEGADEGASQEQTLDELRGEAFALTEQIDDIRIDFQTFAGLEELAPGSGLDTARKSGEALRETINQLDAVKRRAADLLSTKK